MRAWRTHEYGPDPVSVLRLDEVEVPVPGPDEVLVRAEGIPLNLNDLERVTGGNMAVRPDLPYAPGMEVAGVVEAAGPGAEHWVGRRVAAVTRMAHGGYAEQCICPAAAVFPMPAEIPMPEAAAILFPFHLAWLGLVGRAGLQAGETVLVHAAAGGSGTAAVQLAKQRGATVIASVGSAAKADLCRELGADVVVDYSAEDVAAAVLDATGGRGVDVVFDNVGPAVFEASLKATAYNGRYVLMGFASDKEAADTASIVPRLLSMANVRLCGVVLAYVADALVPLLKGAMGANLLPASLGAEIHAEVLALLASGAVRPVVGHTAPFEELPHALARMAARQTTGRVVVTL